MKKSKILVPAIALLALGVAGSATGTVAWFKASSAQTSVVADTASVQSISGVTTADNFTVTAQLTGTLSDIYLTNDDGVTKILVGTENVVVSPTVGSAYKQLTVNFKVDYVTTGSEVSAEYVKSAWTETVKASGINFTATDTSSDVVSGGGLKFWTAAPSGDFAGASSVSVNCTKATAIEGNFSAGTGAAGKSYTMTVSCNLAIYVGVKGVDSVEQTATDSYQVTVTPAFGA